MAAGFQLIGSQGVVQINDTTPNFVFYSKGTLTTQLNNEPNFDNYKAVFVISGSCPIVCFKSAEAVLVHSIVRSGNNYTYTIASRFPATFTYYHFDLQPNVSNLKGLTIYTSTGSVVFNSDYKPMRLVSIAVSSRSSDPAQATNPGSTITLPSGNWAGATTVASYAQGVNGGYRYSGGHGIRTTATQVLEEFVYASGPTATGVSPSIFGSLPPSTVFAVDVSNL